MEEFEEKINKLGDKEESNEEKGNWMYDLLKQLEEAKAEVEEEMEEKQSNSENKDDLYDIEPPLLDNKWSLTDQNGWSLII